ncbi:universal stress protein [uncultured Massilia sp.]|uniref:universal stress protein n=1 Tax=uncultured Massilia sp. TaxID=169973 RepID=UPI0025FD0ED9|nr:universal stress protein [uncultured Massilia sp.]
MYARILVPTDGSDISAQAERAAIEFARAHGSTVVALCIGQPYPPAAAIEGAMAIDPATENAALQAWAARNAARVAEAAKAAGVDCVPVATIAYAIGDAILEQAERHGCDLIFMGSHGRRGLSRLLAGSVTQDVLSAAPVPVMVLRPSPQPAAPRR